MPKRAGGVGGGKRAGKSSRSQTPAETVLTGNGSADPDGSMLTSIPANGPISLVGSGEGRREMEWPMSSEDDSGSSYGEERVRARPGVVGVAGGKKGAERVPVFGDSANGVEGAPAARKRRSTAREEKVVEEEVVEEVKTKGKGKGRKVEKAKEGNSKPPSKQSTLESHFRKVPIPAVDSSEAVEKAPPKPENLKFKVKFKGQAPQETVVLQTNPPSSDPVEGRAPGSSSSPPPMAENPAIMAVIDANGRGRRATRNAAPCYSGFPTAAGAETVPPPTTATRESSPKARKRATRSVSPRRNGTKADPSTTTTSTTTGGRRAAPRPKCLDEAGRFIDVEPPKQVVQYGSKGVPGQHECGQMPLGVLPPRERVDEVFNKPVPREPETWCEFTSGQQYNNFWGTIGNRDGQKLRGDQTRSKKAAMKRGRLDANNDWIILDTDEEKEVKATTGNAKGKGKQRAKRPRVSTSRGHEMVDASSPDFVQDHQLRSTEELVSPASDNVPETPQEFPSMQIDDLEVRGTRDPSENPGVGDRLDAIISEAAALGEPAKKQAPDMGAVIRQARLTAEKVGDADVMRILNSAEGANNSAEALDILVNILRGGSSSRLSPATVPGTKRTALQRDEDEGIVSGDGVSIHEKKRQMLKPFLPPVRPNRPDAQDNLLAETMNKMTEKARRTLESLNAKYVPDQYNCLRGEPDNEGEPLYPDVEDRAFKRDEEEFTMEWERTGPQLQRAMDFTAGRNRTEVLLEDGRRRNTALEGAEAEDTEMGNAQVTVAPDHLMDDEESKCTVCKQAGAALVMCDGEGCKEEQHYACAFPPLTEEQVDELPEWYCRECRAKRKKTTGRRQNPEYKGIMRALLETADQVNPRSFTLPTSLRSTYTGVKTGKLGTYKTAVDYFVLNKTKDKDLRAYDHLRRINGLTFRKQLLGSDGEIAVCYKCRETRLRKDRGQLIGCDYCPVYWHQDCLPTPLTEPPAIKTRMSEKPGAGEDVVLMKWKCPLHVPEEVFRTRQPRGEVEGADTQWPPKHRLPPKKAAVQEAPTGDFHLTKVCNQDLLIPDQGITLNPFPNVRRAQQQKMLDETVFTGGEMHAIEILRNLRNSVRDNRISELAAAAQSIQQQSSASANGLAEFIWRNVPASYRRAGIEEAILNGEIADDAAEQIRLITAIQKSMEAKLQRLRGSSSSF